MNRTRTTSIALALGVLIVLLSLAATTPAQQANKFVADTGLIVPGPHQKLRLTVTATGKTALTIRFRQMEYMPETCNTTSVCKLSVSSQITSAPVNLNPGEAVSMGLLATTYGRGTVMSNSQDGRVTLELVDTATGQTDSILIALLLP